MGILRRDRDDQAVQESILGKFRAAVASTRRNLVARMEQVLQGKTEIDADLLDELEGILVGADIGITTSMEVLDKVKAQVNRSQINDATQLKISIKSELLRILDASSPQAPDGLNPGLQIILVVGVNGVGKTTTAAKLASRFRREGKGVLVCAADTFRAAAVEQLEEWGRRAGVNVIRQQSGTDPSAVLFDAINAAKSRNVDILIVDTAGRLHTKNNLMAELEKMKRIAGRAVAGGPHQILLVIDATTGQNGLIQAKEFTRCTGVSGIILTKLDGTAKGGVVLGIARDLGIPIHYVGVGEQIGDLIPFSPEHFIQSLFD
jgi:fused signal recognition particle receptor